VILSGSQSALVPVSDGDELVCTVGGLGACRVRFLAGAPHEPHPEPARHRPLAERVHQAQTGARPMPRLTEDFPAMT
jgi:2-keto-4-pentenoate hydratase